MTGVTTTGIATALIAVATLIAVAALIAVIALIGLSVAIAQTLVAWAMVACALVVSIALVGCGAALIAGAISGDIAGSSSLLATCTGLSRNKRRELALKGGRGSDGRGGGSQANSAREHITIITVARDIADLELRRAPEEFAC